MFLRVRSGGEGERADTCDHGLSSKAVQRTRSCELSLTIKVMTNANSEETAMSMTGLVDSPRVKAEITGNKEQLTCS